MLSTLGVLPIRKLVNSPIFKEICDLEEVLV